MSKAEEPRRSSCSVALRRRPTSCSGDDMASESPILFLESLVAKESSSVLVL